MDSPKWTCASECLSMCCACVCPRKEEERDLSDLASPAEHMAVKNLLKCSTLSLCTLVFLTLVAQNVAQRRVKKCLPRISSMRNMCIAHSLLRRSRTWASGWECAGSGRQSIDAEPSWCQRACFFYVSVKSWTWIFMDFSPNFACGTEEKVHSNKICDMFVRAE